VVVAKRIGNKQLPPPEAVMKQAGLADDGDATNDNGRIVLTPLHPGGVHAVRDRLRELGISESDVADAVSWARNA